MHMMKIMLVPIHSLASVITNSSSELFICNTDKDQSELEEFFAKLSDLVGDTGIGKISLHEGPNALLETLIRFSGYIDEDMVISVLRTFIGHGFDDIESDMQELVDYLKAQNIADDELPDWWVENGYIAQWFYRNDEKLRSYIGKFAVVRSRGDNSIPDDIFDIIETRLKASHIHLG